MYTTLAIVGALAGGVGWIIAKRRVSASEAERSRSDEKTRKRFARRAEVDGPEIAVEVRPRRRDFGRR